jgi:hypothetical protein
MSSANTAEVWESIGVRMRHSTMTDNNRAAAHLPPLVGVKKILVPTDFSPHADEAFRTANSLAQATGAEVIVFHISHPPVVATEGGPLVTGSGLHKPANAWDRFHKLPPTEPGVRVEHVTIVSDKPGMVVKAPAHQEAVRAAQTVPKAQSEHHG